MILLYAGLALLWLQLFALGCAMFSETK